jgi:hypothetical protein
MTKKVSDTLNLTIQEYTDMFSLPKGTQSIDWKLIEAKLHNEMEWTNEGAEQLAALVRDYGAFILRNALALAISLGIEDGELGY